MSIEVYCEECGVLIERYEDEEPLQERHEMCRVCEARMTDIAAEDEPIL
jgi:hypothetical protein